MINTIWGSTTKPVSSTQLADILSDEMSLEGTLYIGYPIIGTPEGSFQIDALLLSPEKGLVIFNLVEGAELGTNYKEQQDEAFTKMQSKLLQHRTLIRKRKLSVMIHTVTFAPIVSDLNVYKDIEYPLCSSSSLVQTIVALDEQDSEVFEQLVAAIQAISTLRRGRKKRGLNNTESRGTKLKALEDSIANLDLKQGAAVVETFEGVQRLRGLAGSGKTIVLALKVAYLHVGHPDWDIAVTFYTRSLKKQFEDLITKFVLHQSNEEPDWEKVRILNSWGAPGGQDRTGIYYEFCQEHRVEYYDFGSARNKFGRNTAFEDACEVAHNSVKNYIPKYDAIIVDEAQDFAPNFLLLCYELLRNPKRLIYAYDELQSLEMRALPPMEEIFGNKPDGSPRVIHLPKESNKPKQDIVLDTCYRNSRPVLTTAHALGFGIYRYEGLVQIFDNSHLWLEVGYTVNKGELADGESVVLTRKSESSPEFLEKHSTIEDLISFQIFNTQKEQTEYLVESVIKNLTDDELLPDDIIVINPDPLKTIDAVKDARKLLLQRGFNSHLAGVSNSTDIFTEPGTVTFTGIFRAKGNESGMVYIINAQDCFSADSPRETTIVRNRLFTAITRSKAWVRVFGVGSNMVELKKEFEKVKSENFQLCFNYPTESEREKIITVNRDMSITEKNGLRRNLKNLEEILESLKSGENFIEDYPEKMIKMLQEYLQPQSK